MWHITYTTVHPRTSTYFFKCFEWNLSIFPPGYLLVKLSSKLHFVSLRWVSLVSTIRELHVWPVRCHSTVICFLFNFFLCVFQRIFGYSLKTSFNVGLSIGKCLYFDKNQSWDKIEHFNPYTGKPGVSVSEDSSWLEAPYPYFLFSYPSCVRQWHAVQGNLSTYWTHTEAVCASLIEFLLLILNIIFLAMLPWLYLFLNGQKMK